MKPLAWYTLLKVTVGVAVVGFCLWSGNLAAAAIALVALSLLLGLGRRSRDAAP